MIKTFYVSLVKDLLGTYLAFEAESEQAVREYLLATYNFEGTWKLPWCGIYEEIPECDLSSALIIRAKCGLLHEGRL